MSKYCIKVTTETKFLEQYSQPENNRFAFAYTISIENCSEMSAQLLSRHWLITDAKDSVKEIFGEGVVGKQPHISPCEKYTYSSNAVIETHVGTMEGSYTMRAADGTVFDVAIPPFSLIHPQSLH